MSHAPASATAERLNQRLRRCHQRGRLGATSVAAATAAAAILLAALAAISIDAVLGLPASGLLALNAALAVVALAGLGWVGYRAWQWRFRPRSAAVAVERAMGWDDNRLINAIDLSGLSDQPHPTQPSPSLCGHVIATGEAATARLRPDTLVNWQRLRRALGGLATILALALLSYVMLPGVYQAVVPRLAQPWADHPPFTLLSFEIAHDPSPVYYGNDAQIYVAIDGPQLPERASVVFIDEHGQQQRQAMHRRTDPDDAMVQRIAGNGSTPEDAEQAYFALPLERLEASRTFYIDTADGRSARHELPVLPVPLFEQVTLDYDYPSYTGRDDRTEPLQPRGITALHGTHATVIVQSNIALAGGDLTLEPAEGEPRQIVLQPDADDPTRARGTFELNFDGRFAMALKGADNTPGIETLSGRIEAVPDQPPSVRIRQPQQQVLAPLGHEVEFEVRAEDDIAVDELTLTYRIDEGPTQTRTLELHPRDDAGRQVRATDTLDAQAMGAGQDQVIHYYATAYDNHPDTRQSTDSQVHTLHVISMEQYKEHARQQYQIAELQSEWRQFRTQLQDLQEQREQILQEMAALEQALDAGEQLSQDEHARLAELTQELEQYATQAQQLANDMQQRADQPQLYAFEQAYQDMLEQTAGDLSEQAAAAQALATDGQAAADSAEPTADGLDIDPGASRTLLDALAEFNQQQAPFEQEQIDQRELTDAELEKLRMLAELQAQAARLMQIIEAQRELTERMARFSQRERLNPTEQLQAAQMAEQQLVLREELADVRETLDDYGQRVEPILPQAGGSAIELAELIEQLEIERDQDDATRLAAAGHGRYAYQAAASARDKLESLVGECDAMMGSPPPGESPLDGPLNLTESSLQQSLEQMLAAAMAGMPSLGPAQGDGSGYDGSGARFAVVGPAMQRGGDADASEQALGDGVDGTGTQPGQADPPAEPDRVQVERAEARGSGGVRIEGVPAAFQDLAGAYFQRLADESD